MQDLKDVTRDVHYENYRAQYITKISQQAARERKYVLLFIQLWCSWKFWVFYWNKFVFQYEFYTALEKKGIFNLALPLYISHFSKLRRDSGPNFEAVSETDRLLQQKEEEVRDLIITVEM